MIDQFESKMNAAERIYDELYVGDGKMKCPSCDSIFNPDNEGGTVSPDPYAMPVCGKCLGEAMEYWREIKTKAEKKR